MPTYGAERSSISSGKNRPSQDLDVATENPAPMADIAATLGVGLEAHGWEVHTLESAPLSASLT